MNAVSDFATKIDTIDSNSPVADALVSVAGYGTSNSASSTMANITAQDVGGAHALLKAMNFRQLAPDAVSFNRALAAMGFTLRPLRL